MAAAAARCAAAADALSNLDLVDRALMSTQSWSLLPVEACLAVSAGQFKFVGRINYNFALFNLSCFITILPPQLLVSSPRALSTYTVSQASMCAACPLLGSTVLRLLAKLIWDGSFRSCSEK
jgi:hypothetical protein